MIFVYTKLTNNIQEAKEESIIKQVKGSIFVSIIRGIRSNKTGLYDDILSKEAKDLVSKRMLNTSWYPFEIYKECLNAVARFGVKGDMDVIKNWGFDYYNELVPTIYKEGIKTKDIKEAMETYKRFFGMIYNFGTILIDFPSENELVVTYKDHDPNFEVVYVIWSGLTENFVESCVDKKCTSSFIEKSWEGAELTKLRITW
ncbi:MAG: hypothetical protein ACFFBP_05345 [Promethearchaeota archaeon]